MRVFAYCAKSFEAQVRRAAGVQPFTSPPHTVETFEPSWMQGYDLLYFDLHGYVGRWGWHGEEDRALCPEGVMRATLSDPVVFTASCYAGPDHPMVEAFLDAGARVVIGGLGQNFEYSHALIGANLLGMWLRRLLSLGLPWQVALEGARLKVRLGRRSHKLAAQDALAFQGYV